jgi:glycosyltransferase involved in cell wall biosynthesis
MQSSGPMRIVALIAVRNEALYLERCLAHLYVQGVETCLIDNESTDDTVAIAEQFLQRGVFRIETYAYPGFFDFSGLLRRKAVLASEINADWFIYHDADEIREPPVPYKNLREAIIAVDRQGYTAINFDEFVFVPTSDSDSFEGTDYTKTMRHYYFFEPVPVRQVKAWKNTGQSVELLSSGGHRVSFDGRRIYPVNFIMRHYIVLSRAHAIQKYGSERMYSPHEVKNGWHRERARFDPARLYFTPASSLKCVDDGPWDKSDPWVEHKFLSGE